MRVQAGYVGGDTAFWLAWTSIQNSILPSDKFARWFTGKEIEITYEGPDATSKTTRFSLTGLAAAVHAGTGLETP